MKIIKDKNNVVTHAGENLELTTEGLLGPGYRSRTVTTKTHSIEDVESIPQDWTGGDYAYDGAWTLTAAGTTKKQARFVAAKAEKFEALSKYVRLYFDGAMKDYSEWEAISWPILIQETAQFQIDGTVGEYMAAEIGLKYPTAADLAFVLLQRASVMKGFRAGMVLTRQQKEIEINAAQTTQDLDKIDITAGWPE